MSENAVHGVRHYRKWGYEVRDETHMVGEDDAEVRLKSAYTPSGDYIGSPKDARFLCARMGIAPERRTPQSNVCSIGFSVEKNKWFGWSHRAIVAFGVGDEVKEGDCIATDNGLPVGFKAKTFEDCKTMAAAFAESVS